MQSRVKIRGAGGGWRRVLTGAVFGLGLLSIGLGIGLTPALAGPGFQEAVADYNAGHYARALGTLQAVKSAYPTNALVHYYLALCEQAVGHIEQAKAEYQWVIASRDPKLAPMAATGLAQLSGARTSGSGSSSSSSMAAPSSGGQRAATGKVKKVLEFWATW
ncbi:MAG: hypothetical protein JSS86_08765 [Cyanobacteria bacterium SZAS LIN-2]|nr:hypothetical protein [Cyanobacteria bacterium SZAS LIN-3]MBS1996387.1 hypothetical protein [Cyanobacteria bacterium SZAS LIN-2]MBS2007075.1 hypothetical protein [Cyanobacteria bacterium SZAS TMP-1]